MNEKTTGNSTYPRKVKPTCGNCMFSSAKEVLTTKTTQFTKCIRERKFVDSSKEGCKKMGWEEWKVIGIIGTISSLKDLIADYGDIRVAEVVRREKHVYNTSDSCVCCGAYVPEGAQVCQRCKLGIKKLTEVSNKIKISS